MADLYQARRIQPFRGMCQFCAEYDREYGYALCRYCMSDYEEVALLDPGDEIRVIR